MQRTVVEAIAEFYASMNHELGFVHELRSWQFGAQSADVARHRRQRARPIAVRANELDPAGEFAQSARTGAREWPFTFFPSTGGRGFRSRRFETTHRRAGGFRRRGGGTLWTGSGEDGGRWLFKWRQHRGQHSPAPARSVLRTAILLRAMVPFEPDQLPDLSGVRVWIAGGDGRHDYST